ncbi:MAG TPA: Era-like GTP-binding protein [Methanosarcina vacuolata]|uniref:Era-like GTP-binding protein n=1 Tax=Methanosarcina sp. DH1 TaxID=2605695 RepID=UPI001E49078B|nr:Era-like GTP-binding protein [Methanosarcina sp. DH1]MCC4767376.1 GTP-binding protein [Methanosarcina sp. DH1]HPS89876.1 Era-like GTP-binding protein [Methanosarcina vacuolata]
MNMLERFKVSFSKMFNKLFKKKGACIGIYGPPNAGKTTLSNRILKDWVGAEETMGSVSHIAHETRHAKRRNAVSIEANGHTISLDIVDTPGLATKIDFHDFMEQGMSDSESKKRSKEATEGVIEAVKWLDDLDGVILVMDSTENPYTQVNVTVIGNMEARNLPLLIVANKVDLPDADPAVIKEAFPQHPMVPVSALEGVGMDSFYEALAKQFG